MSSVTEVTVPDIGDFEEARVIEVLVVSGDTVQVDEPLIMLESEKATMEIPSPIAGTVADVLVSVNDRVRQGTPIVSLAIEEGPAGTNAEEVGRDDRHRAEPAQADGSPVPRDDFRPTAFAHVDHPAHASPSVRAYARQLGVDVHAVPGTGAKGRILRSDVEEYVRRRLRDHRELDAPSLPAIEVDFAKHGEVERIPLPRFRKLSGPSLARNWATIPLVTSFAEADITELEKFRRAVNAEGEVRLTVLAFALTASVVALKRFPEFNSSLDGDHLVLKKYYHIGFAVDSPQGLLVPVVRDADRKGLLELAKEISELAVRARTGKLGPDALQGGSFSVSSLGGVPGLGFTPLVNAPEVAILGMAQARMQPVWDGQAFQPRLVLPLTLSWDHRAVDGAAAGKFLADVAATLSDARRVLL